MRILIINWRDPQNPLEGGAERITKKYAEYWAGSGNQVFWLSNRFGKSRARETLNGITYIRISPSLDGSLLRYSLCYPLYLLKTIWFANKFIKQEKIDLVIDEIHGLPFFTPVFSQSRNVLLSCEVAGPIWNKMFPFPFNLIGQFIEKIIYRIYINTEIWSISEHTKQNIKQLLPGKKIKVIKLGIDENREILAKIKNVNKTRYPSAVFLARLVKMKGIEIAIQATAEIANEYPGFKLFVIGSGRKTYVANLHRLVKQLSVVKNVKFLGKVSEFEKYKYLKKAHFLLHPSYHEGFGLTVLEAGLVGTPAIVRAGCGLDHRVDDGVNGYHFVDEKEIAKIVTRMYQGDNLQVLEKNSARKAKAYIWTNVLDKLDDLS